jgi:hypothetical protein
MIDFYTASTMNGHVLLLLWPRVDVDTVIIDLTWIRRIITSPTFLGCKIERSERNVWAVES